MLLVVQALVLQPLLALYMWILVAAAERVRLIHMAVLYMLPSPVLRGLAARPVHVGARLFRFPALDSLARAARSDGRALLAERHVCRLVLACAADNAAGGGLRVPPLALAAWPGGTPHCWWRG